MPGPDIPHTIDWRMVLRNLHLGWPEDAIQQAKDLRDAELRAAGPCPACGQTIPEEERR